MPTTRIVEFTRPLAALTRPRRWHHEMFPMPVPNESLHLLLSGYLDDALSVDERQHVERWLQTDPDAARELQSLRSLQESLRALAASEELALGPKFLGPKFAERVVESAIARAQTEGLSDDHPLVCLAEQPTGGVASARRTTGARSVALLLAGLAASILLAVVLFRPGDGDRRAPKLADSSMSDSPVSDSSIAEPSGPTPESPDPELPNSELRSSGRDASDQRSPSPLELAGTPPQEMSRDTVTEPVPAEPGETGLPNEQRSEPMIADSVIEPSPVDRPSSVEQLHAILVLDVRRTESGKASLAVRRAIERAAIGSGRLEGSRDSVVSAVAESGEASDEISGSIVYLEAPAKQLDHFVMALIADENGIESVGWSIAFDVPLLRTVDAIRKLDPTTVRHSESRWVPVQDAGRRDTLTGSLQDQVYLPIDGNQTPQFGTLGLSTTADDSLDADVVAPLLVFIR